MVLMWRDSRDSSTRSPLQRHHLSTSKQGTSHVDKIIVKSYLKRNDRKLVSKKHQKNLFCRDPPMGWDGITFATESRDDEIKCFFWKSMVKVDLPWYLYSTHIYQQPLTTPFPFLQQSAACFFMLFQHHTDTISKSRADSAVVMWSVLF